jgi:hypothetical protein
VQVAAVKIKRQICRLKVIVPPRNISRRLRILRGRTEGAGTNAPAGIHSRCPRAPKGRCWLDLL